MRTLLALTATLVIGGSAAAFARPAQPPAHTAHRTAIAVGQAPTVPRTYDVTAGYGDDDYAADIFNPRVIRIFVGDTVRWHDGSLIEPHDVAFGPISALGAIHSQVEVVTPQKSGPPVVTLGPQVAFPSPGTTYNGTGVAHSGLLRKGAATWSLTFTRPGTYRYFCLLHYVPGSPSTSMGGVVEVLPRPTVGHIYHVASGYDDGSPRALVDAFFPEDLTIHAGDTVVWTPGFHTVSFGRASLLAQLRRTFVRVVPRSDGPPTVVFNAQALFPAGGSTYDGTGFANSGMLLRPKPHAYALTFTRPGVYRYACLIHPGMDGTITVLPAGR
jgi:plastocyanin